MPDARLPSDDHDAAIYTVGQVADMLGVQPAFLRRLDAERVVQPARSAGGQRRYSRAEIDQVQRVSAFTADGLTLAGIRRILALEAELAAVRSELAAHRARRGGEGTRPEPVT
ncbi:MAG TPA: MerR family transcriptional regulator [Acidimicrobiales bacterium]|nr:MerR family transcriptional regulator [Acidimicrobiales bacterium]